MKATDIQPGDRYLNDDGTLGYTVFSTRTEEHSNGSRWVLLGVEYADGGDGLRSFLASDDIPVARGTQ